MKSTIVRVAVMVTRLAGVVALILGVLIWLGHGGAVVPAHMGSGMLLVLALWVLAALALGAAPGAAVSAAAWGAIVPALGIWQVGLLPGDKHGIIQIVHLLIGVVAMYYAERLAAAVRRQGSGAR